MLKSFRTLFRILDFTGPYKIMLWVGMSLIMAEVIFSVGIVVAIQNIINAMAANDTGTLFTYITYTLAGCILCILLMMLGTAIRKYAAAQTNKRMTLAALDHANKLKYSYTQQNHTGDLVERINTDTGKATGVITDGIVPLVTNMLTCIAAFIYLSDINFTLALLAAATGPVTFAVGRFFDLKIRKTAEEFNNSEGSLRSLLQDFLHSMALVRVLGIEKVFSEKFNTLKDRQMKIVKKKALLDTCMWRCVVIVNNSVTILLAFIIAKAAIDSTISIGAVLSFLFLLGRLQWPFVNISSTWGTIQNAFGSADRVFKILDMETENYQVAGENNQDAGEFSQDAGEFSQDAGGNMCFDNNANEQDDAGENAVQIESMSFSYANNELFRNFNLLVKKGETVGIVGSSGSGKTTLAKLCCGLFIPEKGEIKIMGRSIKSNLVKAREQLSYVAQTPYIFTGTAGENIYLGCPKGAKYCEDAVQPAARMANAHSFIEKLDDGYNTALKENGSNISGGQKQRINIARALAKDAPLIIFDEATSSLDNESEMLIQETINNLMGSKTLIVIAHRLTTVQNLSRIIVLDNGRIAEEGTHDELLKLKGMYNSLWNQVPMLP